MSTQKELKQLIETEEHNLKMLQTDYSENAEWLALKTELDQVENRIKELRNKKYTLENSLRVDRQSTIQLKYDDIKYYKKLLYEKENGLNPKDFNEDVQRMFKGFYSGSSDYGYNTILQWVSDDGKFAIFKKKAFQAYINRGQTSYSEAFWCLMKVDENYKGYDGNSRSSLSMDSPQCIWKTEGGRWNKERMAECMLKIKEYNK